MWINILFKSCIVDRCASSDNWIEIEKIPVFPEWLRWISTVESKYKLLDCEDKVLQEKVVHKIGSPNKIPAAMNKEQSLKVSKLTKVIVTA